MILDVHGYILVVLFGFCFFQSDEVEESVSTASNSTQDIESSDDTEDFDAEESMSLFSQKPSQEEPSKVNDSLKVLQPVYNNYNCQVIIKAMFKKAIVGRNEAIKVLKEVFKVKQEFLTNLTPAQALETLAKKLINAKYVAVLNPLDPQKLRISDVHIKKIITL